jgi:hypothetical protein
VVFPDVCQTPVPYGVVPIPYANVGRSADTAGGPTTIRCDGRMAMVRGARYVRSSGDEPGTFGGVVSHVRNGRCECALWSFDVTFEGRGVCRLGDLLFHNCRNAVG